MWRIDNIRTISLSAFLFIIPTVQGFTLGRYRTKTPIHGSVLFSYTSSIPSFTLAETTDTQIIPLESINVEDAVEIADLPPPYVPLLIAALILVGVGLLTGSLGDVYSEGKEMGLLMI
jgi:hypothetical protein